MSLRKKRTTLTVAQKMEILDKLETGWKRRDIAQEYGVTEDTVSKIKANRDVIRKEWEDGHLGAKSCKKAKYQKVDEALTQWYSERRAENAPASRQASVFANPLGVGSFKTSGAYAKKRQNTVSKAIASQSATVDNAVCSEWVNDTLPGSIANYSSDEVYNAEESGIVYRSIPKTYTYRNEDKSGEIVEEEIVEIVPESRVVSFAEAFDAVQVLKAYCTQHNVEFDMQKCEQAIVDARFNNPTHRRNDIYYSSAAATAEQHADETAEEGQTQQSTDIAESSGAKRSRTADEDVTR